MPGQHVQGESQGFKVSSLCDLEICADCIRPDSEQSALTIQIWTSQLRSSVVVVHYLISLLIPCVYNRKHTGHVNIKIWIWLMESSVLCSIHLVNNRYWKMVGWKWKSSFYTRKINQDILVWPDFKITLCSHFAKPVLDYFIQHREMSRIISVEPG